MIKQLFKRYFRYFRENRLILFSGLFQILQQIFARTEKNVILTHCIVVSLGMGHIRERS